MDSAEMLTLEAVIYRGCEYNLSNAHSRKIVFDEMARCLGSFRKTAGKWELAWGPAGYRPGLAGLDISAMYVARDRNDQSNLAIVVRGTNLFSVLDWLSNLPLAPTHWEYGGAGSKVQISASTWLGLRLLQGLQSGAVPAPDASETPAEQAQAAAAKAEAAGVYALIENLIRGAAQIDAASYLTKIEEHIASIVKAGFAPGHDPRLAQAISDAQQTPPSSNTLLEFLKDYVARATAPVNIQVIGHSKGGALAPALALWLADTQGTSVAGAQQWDPASKARLHVSTFAAPTPGNAYFAERYQSAPAIVERYRLANTYDIVPHVWEPDEVRKISGLYRDQLTSLEIPLGLLADALEIVAYQHEFGAPIWTGPDQPQANFLQRAAVEHLDGYLKLLGLYDAATMSTLALFAPIPVVAPVKPKP
jgi:hypothetical protein